MPVPHPQERPAGQQIDGGRLRCREGDGRRDPRPTLSQNRHRPQSGYGARPWTRRGVGLRNARGHRRRRVRRTGDGHAPRGRPRRRDRRRPQQLPHLPAAALPGGHVRPERRRRRLPGAGLFRPLPATPRSAGPRSPASTGTPRAVLLDGGATLPFDYLVVAAGATPTTSGFRARPSTPSRCTRLRDAIRLRNHLLRPVRGGRRPPRPGRRGRPHLRGGRRGTDRGGDRRRGGRAVRRRAAQGLPGRPRRRPRPGGAGRDGRQPPARHARPAPGAMPPRPWPAAGSSCGSAPASNRSTPPR